MKKNWSLMVFGVGMLLAISGSWSATNNSSNPPTFLWLDICTNGIGDTQSTPVGTATVDLITPRMSPDTVDVGVDINADGTVDRWLSQEKSEYLGRDNQDSISNYGWRRFLIRLDADAGKQAKIRIVDKSANYYIAVKAIRLNYADGVMVPNLVPNGFFEEPTPLKGWNLLEGSITDPAKLITEDDTGTLIFYGNQFYSTWVTGIQDTAVVESDAFTLTPPSSFVYGLVCGGGSELWNKKGWGPDTGSDNASYVYLDMGTETQDPNGKYDEGIDVPLTGFSPLDRTGALTTNMFPVFLNTSGLEGKRAQVVVVDDSTWAAVQVDGWRMNWDPTYIPNGGFEDVPADWDNTVRQYSDHPSGKIPGWTVTTHKLPDGSAADGTVYFYGITNNNFTDKVYVGTVSGDALDRALKGVELRSSVFTIAKIPDPSKNVFLQYAGAQGTNRIYADGTSASVELKVDVDGNGNFDDTQDYTYREMSQGMGWNLNTSNLDLWQYPEYRFYIKPEHYGKKAVIYAEDFLVSGYAWMCLDDFFLWNGKAVVQPFPNADFEMGDLTNWNEEPISSLSTWLGGTPEIIDTEGKTGNVMMNGRYGSADGNYSADCAEGDTSTGTLTSVPFTIPALTPIWNYDIY